MSLTKILAGNCIVSKGYKKSLIIDTQNSYWYHVDFDLDEKVSNFDELDIEIQNHLLEEGIVIEIPNQFLSNFTKMNLEYDSPPPLEYAIFDRDKNSKYSLLNSLKLIRRLGVKYLEIRFYSLPTINEIKLILSETFDSFTESIEFILPHNQNLIEFFELELTNFPKINKVLFYGVTTIENLNTNYPFVYINEVIESSNQCGQISPYIFSNSKKHILKSINYNSCLYKKVGIDVEGNIKNCPSLNIEFGNVDDDDLSNHIPHFETELINKDKIEVCKDCEFRYICTDCRAYTDSSKRLNARPSKCNYNPYIAKWSHEDGYKTLFESGVISNEEEFSIDYDKIDYLNQVMSIKK